MSNKLRSFLIVVMSIVIVAAALPLQALMVSAGEGDDYWEIVYEADNGSGDSFSHNITKGDKEQIPEIDYEYDGYIGTAWTDGTNDYEPGTTIDVEADMTLKVKWEEAVTVTFESNGGSGEMESMTVLKGNNIVLAPNSFEAPSEGMIFAGWNTDAAGYGSSYTNKEVIKNVLSDITLYAQWRNPCVITFDKNNNEASGEMPDQTIGQGYNTPLNVNSFTRPGYVFIGWSMTPEAGVSFQDNGMANFSSDTITLYAQWAEARKVTVLPGEAEGQSYYQEVGKNTGTNLEECKFTREHYVFDGWVDQTSSATYADKAYIAIENDMTLVAKWRFDSANSAKITFNKNGGQGADMEQQIVFKDKETALNANTYTLTDRTFKFWTTNQDGTGTTYTDKANITVNADTVLYAQWAENCKLILHSNVPDETDVTYEQPIGKNVPTAAAGADVTNFVYEHHAITGWNTEADGNGTHYDADHKFDITADLQLYAEWTCYTVTFVDDDESSTVLDTGIWAPGETPVYSQAEPTKAPDVQYTYKFSGWTPEIAAVTDADQTYTAVYEGTLRKYTITFVNYDDEELWSGEVEYGTTPSYSETPTKPATAQYSFVFDGWNEEIVPVDGPKTYKATFINSVNAYTISYVNYDGTVLQSETLNYGDMPSYKGETPTKAGDAQYSYSFTGWDSSELTVTGDKIYTAQFKQITNKYTITFLNENGDELAKYDVEYGATPAYTGATPTKPSTQEFSYTFAGWDKPIAKVTGEATYRATFTATTNEYTVTFKNEDGTVLQTGLVKYNTVPYYKQPKPTKASDAQYSYNFKGWSPAVTAITEDTVYVAEYDKTLNKYKITFANEDGSVLQASEFEYGSLPEYTGATPTKSATVEYTFTFEGWDKTISKVTGEATYTAKYSAKPITKDDLNFKHFTVTFESNGGSEVVSQLVADGAKAFKPEEPMRERYTFGGWFIDPELTKPFSFTTPITADITIYAKWIKGNQDIQVTYAVVGDGSIKWALESGENVTITIERSQAGDDAVAQHVKGIQIDGENFYEYEANDDNTEVTLKAFELEKYEPGKHTVTILFDDGQATVELIVEDATKPTGVTATGAETTETTEAVTVLSTTEKTPSYLGLWIALGIVGLVCICAFPILVVKRRGIK